jgi:SEC-C motif/Protein of unknown function (DUF2384)
MKMGRNEPCPCGSGKKYKQCCLARQVEAAQSPEQLTWRRVRRAVDEVGGALMKFILEVYGEIAVVEAWAEFVSDDDDDDDDELEFDPETPHASVFFSWLFYRWSPDPYGTDIEDESLHDVVPAREYLQRKGKRLDPVLRSYMEAALEAPFTFYEVLSVEPHLGFRAREFFSSSECWVYEKTAAESMTPGGLFFGSLVRCEGIVLAESMGPVLIPAVHKLELIRFRKQYRLDSDFSLERLCDLDLELIESYQRVTDELLEPSIPELQNTDGEVLVPQTLIYEIDSAENAFAALCDLQTTSSMAELRRAAELDAKGRIARVEIVWQRSGNDMHKTWETTLLGRLVITAKRLRAEVNSDQRAEKLRGIIQARLGAAARYRVTKRQSIQRMLTDHAEAPSAALDAEQAELMQNPELQAHLRKMLSAHYEGWVHEALPALDGQTPMQAVTTADGRESVAVLVDDIERMGAHQPGFDPAIVKRLREQLGL